MAYIPGDKILASLTWTNGGATAFAPKFRLRLYAQSWAIDQTVNIGPWVASPSVAPGGSATVVIHATLPTNFGALGISLEGTILLEGYVDCMIGTAQRDAIAASPLDIYEVVSGTPQFEWISIVNVDWAV